MNMPITVRLATKADIKQSLSSRCTADFEPAYETAVGQPLPSQDFCGTAALPLKPDIARHGWHGRKVPLNGCEQMQQVALLLDDLVGESKECRWHR